MNEHPSLNAMLICDLAIREEGSGKISLIGIFENISAIKFPTQHALLCVYAKLIDAQGDYELRLELVRLEDFQVIGEGRLQAAFADRRVPVEFVFQLAGLVFERPGGYEFRLYANNRSVGQKSFNVVQVPAPTA